MIAPLLSLLLILQPVTPPTEIYLGELVPPIAALKLPAGELSPYEGALLTPRDWVRLKTALEGSRPLCEWAVSEAVASCLAGVEREASLCPDPADCDLKLAAFKNQLASQESRANRAELKLGAYRWAAIGSGVVAVVASSVLFFYARGKK